MSTTRRQALTAGTALVVSAVALAGCAGTTAATTVTSAVAKIQQYASAAVAGVQAALALGNVSNLLGPSLASVLKYLGQATGFISDLSTITDIAQATSPTQGIQVALQGATSVLAQIESSLPPSTLTTVQNVLSDIATLLPVILSLAGLTAAMPTVVRGTDPDAAFARLRKLAA